MEPAPEAPATHPEDDDLEFKPWVKIAAWGVAGAACLASVYALFYHWGYADGVASGEVAERLNLAAEKNIAYVLQTRVAGDETLLDAAQNHAERLGWMKDAAVKREVQGMLLSTLIERGLLARAESFLDEVLPPAAPENEAWAQRMLQVAHALAQAGKWEKAKLYFAALEGAVEATGLSVESLLRERLAAAVGAGQPRAEVVAALEAALSHAGAYPLFKTELLIFLGKLCNEQGERDKALSCFKAALDGVPRDHVPEDPNMAVCCGVALYEIGEPEAAEAWLRAGVSSPETISGASADFRAIALRHLATLSLESGKPLESLAFLCRAEGEATGRIPAESSFWKFMQEQRAWTLYSLHAYEDSLAEFRRTLAATGGDAAMRAQPLEGVTRCCLSLGLPDDALAAAKECVSIRESLMPDDTAALGRVYLLLAQACDQAGKIEQAASAYGRAVEILPQEHPAYRVALAGYAYALTQSRKWAEAVHVWETLIPLIPKGAYDQRETAKARLELCRRRVAESSAPAPASADNTTSPSPPSQDPRSDSPQH